MRRRSASDHWRRSWTSRASTLSRTPPEGPKCIQLQQCSEHFSTKEHAAKMILVSPPPINTFLQFQTLPGTSLQNRALPGGGSSRRPRGEATSRPPGEPPPRVSAGGDRAVERLGPCSILAASSAMLPSPAGRLGPSGGEGGSRQRSAVRSGRRLSGVPADRQLPSTSSSSLVTGSPRPAINIDGGKGGHVICECRINIQPYGSRGSLFDISIFLNRHYILNQSRHRISERALDVSHITVSRRIQLFSKGWI